MLMDRGPILSLRVELGAINRGLLRHRDLLNERLKYHQIDQVRFMLNVPFYHY